MYDDARHSSDNGNSPRVAKLNRLGNSVILVVRAEFDSHTL